MVGGTAATSTLTISTVGSSAGLIIPLSTNSYWYVVAIGPFAMVLAVGAQRTRLRFRTRALLTCALIALTTACGGGAGGTTSPREQRASTPSGASVVTVTATSTVDGI